MITQGKSDYLSVLFNPKANSLNLIRLILATGVIVWHSFPLTGADIDAAPVRQFLANVWVDGFFAISGFLIVGSWVNNPSWWHFISARVLRIFPGFWACLVVTAFIIAPFSAVISAGSPYWGTLSSSNATYVLHNFLLRISQSGIGDTPMGVPYPGSWNGSLWTLSWEFLCYAAVLGLGVTGLLRRRHSLAVLFALALALLVISSVAGIGTGWVAYVARFSVMFLSGALIHRYAARVRVTPTLLAVAAIILALAMFLPDYRAVGALPLAYLLIGSGAIASAPALRLRNDISYGMYIYAFPVQQFLAILSVDKLGIGAFALVSIVATVPLAACSWFLLEKNVLRLKPKRKRLELETPPSTSVGASS